MEVPQWGPGESSGEVGETFSQKVKHLFFHTHRFYSNIRPCQLTGKISHVVQFHLFTVSFTYLFFIWSCLLNQLIGCDWIENRGLTFKDSDSIEVLEGAQCWLLTPTPAPQTPRILIILVSWLRGLDPCLDLPGHCRPGAEFWSIIDHFWKTTKLVTSRKQELIRRWDSERERLRSATGSYPNSVK